MSATLTTLRGPARVVVRQHRWTLRVAGGLAVLAAFGMIAVALRSSHVVEVFEATGCSPDGGTGRACDQTARNYWDSVSRYDWFLGNFASALRFLPVLFGAFVAGPLIARELESGTFRTAWTQSVSPARWLAAKLAVPTVLVLAGSTALAAVLHWARNHSGTPRSPEWYSADAFATTGTVPAAQLLFGLGVGVLTGLLVRRALLALALSGFATGAVVTVFTYGRGLLWPRNTVTGRTLNVQENMWWVETGHLTSGGARLPDDVCAGSTSATGYNRCLADHDITGSYVDYHPQSHFWPLQLVETGILLALAALALALAFRVLRRLHG
ncbi:hypothetical protein AB0M10_24265 [Streptomyces sp. NPDC051840]|uniref:hypothetical protein n=1 Tax=Streptomyces sp. NPDC051840 TaxID=3154752 RepID=UPI003439C321